MKSICFFNLLLLLILSSGFFTSCQPTTKDRLFLVEKDFDKQVKILKKVDSCVIHDPNTRIHYNKENTHFYQIGEIDSSELLLVETEYGCGYTGSCGNRCLIIKDSTEVLYQSCGFIDAVSDSIRNGVHVFYDLSRGYQTGPLKYEVSWTGDEFHAKIISRNNIPWSILTQLPLNKEDCAESYYDCFEVDDLKAEEIELSKNGDHGVLISAPSYVFEHANSTTDQEYYLFRKESNHEYTRINNFYNISDALKYN